jgi:aryl-alcohol dehydrogenase-like predicted oxidoreductase
MEGKMAGGSFSIGGDLSVNRIGFGAMRLGGPGGFGEVQGREDALALLRSLPRLGVTLIDTADAYGPALNERLIREALHPYEGLVIATKGGIVRPASADAVPLGRPEYLKQAAWLSRERLGVERIDLWQLHRIDPAVPHDEQFDAIRQLRDEGVIRHAGLSEVTIEEIEAAERHFPVTTVQNRYNLVYRKSEDVLDYCTARGIGFLPWFPLGQGKLAHNGSAFCQTARRLNATPGQLALAWMLRRSPVLLPIPGTANIAHLEENIAAADIILSDEDFAFVDALGREQAGMRAGERP